MPIVEGFDYYGALISNGISRELLDSARSKGADLSSIYSTLDKLFNGKENNYYHITYDWQLLLLGCKDFDCASLPSEVWQQEDTYGNSPVHYLALFGNTRGLEWVLEHKAASLNNTNHFELNIAHLAAWSGNVVTLQWIIDNKLELFSKPTIDHCTIVHFAAASANTELLRYLLQNHPQSTKKLWIRTQDGATPDNYAASEMVMKPTQILENELLAATKRIMEGSPTTNDPHLLMTFQKEWLALLQTAEDYDAKLLIETVGNFPEELQERLTKLKPVLKLKAFSFDDDGITPTKLRELLRLAKDTLPPKKDMFSRVPQPLILDSLELFLSNLEGRELTKSQVQCLKVIVHDYEREKLHDTSPACQILARKLTLPRTRSEALMSFRELVGLYINEEYRPYIEVMTSGRHPATFIYTTASSDPIMERHNFIITRHNGEPCLPDATYAPEGVISDPALGRYLRDVADGLTKSVPLLMA